jgi:hypothetical protein
VHPATGGIEQEAPQQGIAAAPALGRRRPLVGLHRQDGLDPLPEIPVQKGLVLGGIPDAPMMQFPEVEAVGQQFVEILNFIGNQFSGVLDETDCRQ